MAILAGVSLAGLAASTAAVAAPRVYWGLQVGSHITGGEPPYDLGALGSVERRLDKRASLVSWSLPWRSCQSGTCVFPRFPAAQMQRVREHGAIPLFGWASYSQPLSASQDAFRLSRITRGDHDAFVRSWARAAHAWGHPFFLRFNWEMNVRGVWPYAGDSVGNGPREFIRAWRHVHDIFRREGAVNATWVWCPNIEYPSSTPIAKLYPGARYVDWTCLDGYNWPLPKDTGRRSFTSLFGASYDTLVRTVARGKPVMIGETATTGRAGQKASWIREMFHALPRRFPRVRGLSYFDKYDDGADWALERSPSGTAAFRRGIASARYRSGAFGHIGRAPIRAP